MTYNSNDICEIVGGKLISGNENRVIDTLVYDSRRIPYPEHTLFFAIVTAENDGHHYLQEAFEKGVRSFIVSEVQDEKGFPGSCIIQVSDTVVAMQQLAAFHRSRFQIPVIGITGSNGKTVVKEWLYQLLQNDYDIVRSPKSYNSQIGVPLSVWQMQVNHSLAIFEAGISKVGEMKRLEPVIRPTIGIFINIGTAHEAGFSSRQQKVQEKLQLFQQASLLICNADDFAEVEIQKLLPGTRIFTWSYNGNADVIVKKDVGKTKSHLQAVCNGLEYQITLPYTDQASLQNAVQCWCLLIHLGFSNEEIKGRFQQLHKVEMRMQLLHAINGCMLINDSYSADLTSLQLALHFQSQQSAGLTKTVILSDFQEAGRNEDELYEKILSMLLANDVKKIIGIGEKFSAYISDHFDKLGKVAVQTFHDTASFVTQFKPWQFQKEIILVKGSRIFHLEEIASLFVSKKHQTVLEINLNAITHNLKEYKKIIRPPVKIMAMVKAFSYGSGVAEIANVLQFNKIDFLAVAYADEGVELVKSGIATPIMVMNPDSDAFHLLVEYNLQPALYSLALVQGFIAYIDKQGLENYPVHIEVETGMNRLGIQSQEVDELCGILSSTRKVHILSVYSHLAGSEAEDLDAFSMEQYQHFQEAAKKIADSISYSFLKHIANSAAILRHPSMHLDMVRLGIGLYGIEPGDGHRLDLLPVASLFSTVSQIKAVAKGESISYNRRGVVDRDSRIGVVRIGYADGYNRRFSNGVGKMLVRGQLVPVVGTVCMDMTMIDLTDVPDAEEGDEVEVFGRHIPVQELASWINTIPYEILTGISQRVKRIYLSE